MFKKFTAIFLSLNVVDDGCYEDMSIAAIIVLVPGSGLSFGVLDIISGQLVSGSARLVGAFVQSYLQGLGLLTGYYTSAWYFPPPAADVQSCLDPIPRAWALLFFPIMWVSWLILLDSHPRQFIIYLISLAIATIVSFFTSINTIPGFVSVLVSAIGVGMFANFYGRVSKKYW